MNGSSANGTALGNGVPILNSTRDDCSAWDQAKVSAFDFRSDITTAASQKQLDAIINSGFNDGWCANGARTLEANISHLVGREAALFVVSSTMGNQVALRTHLNRPPNGIICDSRSHIMHQEVGAVAHISGALPLAISPRNGLHLTVEDIERRFVPGDGIDTCTCPTRLLHLEVPLGGIPMPLTELRRIRQFADVHGLKVHIDGARIWEAVAAGYGSLKEYCAEAHSVNLCLTKGVGGSVGSVILGDASFIKHAKWVRKSLGGGMRQPGWVAAAAWAAVEDVFGLDANGSHATGLRRSHMFAQRLAAHWMALGGRLVVPTQTNMIWLDLEAAGITDENWEKGAEERGLLVHCNRVVTHHQTSESGVKMLEEYMTHVLGDGVGKKPIVDPVPRNEAVARLAASMKEAMTFAELRRRVGKIDM